MGAAYADQTKGPRILGVFWAFYTVSVFMVTARLYIRARWLRNIGLDDYIIAVSMVMLTGYTIVTTVNVGLGFGKHTSMITADGGATLLTKVLLINYIDFAFGIMSFTTPKLAIAALLNRIMNPGRFHRVWLWVLTGLVFVSSTICIVVLFTMCDPPEALWKIELMAAGATCRSTSILVGYAIFTGGVSGFADLYLAIYPTVVLMGLQITLKRKLALCAALGLGAVACAMAIVKCFQLPSLYDTSDSTFATADLVIWTSIESNIIIMASCIPTLGPLYEMMLGKRSWSSNQRYYYKDKGSANQGPSTSERHTKRSNFTADKDADLFTTNIGTTREGSQESILRPDLTHGAHLAGRIQRTDQVVVEYEMRPMDVGRAM
ncbi:uncharacterized protein DSM5745_10341 [Aspergillus mulundensis]|uniref:Rhodopsin domain-containing protein n=1 Tax=Aspergillus mulundensis TaxID=1810919 RepID=A0A3D8QNL5_9EURO|nr:Uncharacterized protein DSM5745_10341 [Aspergillus mulundensis]RDW63230.1 Uncharacterized protein DSM5745_10341 [Aspergillus mulundensis]